MTGVRLLKECGYKDCTIPVNWRYVDEFLQYRLLEDLYLNAKVYRHDIRNDVVEFEFTVEDSFCATRVDLYTFNLPELDEDKLGGIERRAIRLKQEIDRL